MIDVISEAAKAKPFAIHLMESRSKLLRAIEGARDITFIRTYGNIGDDLIYAGTRQLLADVHYNEVSIHHVQPLSGDVAIIAGGGGWCGAYPILPKYLPLVETRFKNVIVFPSSYDVSVDGVQEAIENSNALFFAREHVSFDMIKNICNADIAHDCAFFFNYNTFKKEGRGLLNAFREDAEAAGNPVPERNNDISLSCATLDEFLWTIAKHEMIKTDRAHVMIAGALLGKQVEYRSSNYHKLPAIADFGLKDFPVTRVDHLDAAKISAHVPTTPVAECEKNEGRKTLNEQELLWQTVYEITAAILAGASFILIDEEQIRFALGRNSTAIPFTEMHGKYNGPPADDETAINELVRLIKSGAKFIAITWQAFWWLDYYKEWHQYLRENFSCILENDQLLIFDLQITKKAS